MDVWQGDQRRELLQEFERREPNARGAVGPRMSESIDEIAVRVFLEALQGHGPAGGIADEAFQLITPVRRDLGVGVYRKPLHAGTVGACQHGRLARSAKARADAPDPLARPFPKSHALLHGGRQRTSELGCVIHQGVIAGRHCSVATRFQVSQVTELAHDPPTDRLDHGGDVGVGRGLTLEKTRRATLVGAIEVDTLHEDAMEMEVGVRRRLYLIV